LQAIRQKILNQANFYSVDDVNPAAVAVVIAKNPGQWYRETLQSIKDQDIDGLTVLIFQIGEDEEAIRVAGEVLPEAFIKVFTENTSFGQAANSALLTVKNATHFFFCHDDVAPFPGAFKKMLDEALNSNAAVVVPKYVSWQDPSLLLSIGLNTDKRAVPANRVERLELDQGQHDSPRPVAVAPGGAVLIRSDLFSTIGGYDPEIVLFGEGIDISWRTWLAGGKVMTCPEARVRHMEASASGKRNIDLNASGFELWRRHEIRTVLSCLSGKSLIEAITQIVLLGLLEIFWCLLTGKTGRIRSILKSWKWNAIHFKSLLKKRKELKRYSKNNRKALNSILLKRSARLSRFFSRRELVGEYGEPLEGASYDLLWRNSRAAFFIWCAIGFLLIFGSRNLIFSNMAYNAQNLSFLSSGKLFTAFFKGPYLASLDLFLFGILDSVFFNHSDELSHFFWVFMILFGVIGAYKLTLCVVNSRRYALSGTFVVLICPFFYSAIATGQTLALFSATSLFWLNYALLKEKSIWLLSSILVIAFNFVPNILFIETAFLLIVYFLGRSKVIFTTKHLKTWLIAVLITLVVSFNYVINIFHNVLSALYTQFGSGSYSYSANDYFGFSLGVIDGHIFSYGFVLIVLLGLLIIGVGETASYFVLIAALGIFMFYGYLSIKIPQLNYVFLPQYDLAIGLVIMALLAAYLSRYIWEHLVSFRFGFRHLLFIFGLVVLGVESLIFLTASLNGSWYSEANPLSGLTNMPNRVIISTAQYMPGRGYYLFGGLNFEVVPNSGDLRSLFAFNKSPRINDIRNYVLEAWAGKTQTAGELLAKDNISQVVIINVKEAPGLSNVIKAFSLQLDLYKEATNGNVYAFDVVGNNTTKSYSRSSYQYLRIIEAALFIILLGLGFARRKHAL
jgi:GT2 family glycosyltransferase